MTEWLVDMSLLAISYYPECSVLFFQFTLLLLWLDRLSYVEHHCLSNENRQKGIFVIENKTTVTIIDSSAQLHRNTTRIEYTKNDDGEDTRQNKSRNKKFYMKTLLLPPTILRYPLNYFKGNVFWMCIFTHMSH